MKKYFYTNRTAYFGPFTIDELKEKRLSKKDEIWFLDDKSEWKSPGEIPELEEIFVKDLSPVQVEERSDTDKFKMQLPPKNHLLGAVLVTLFCCMPFGLVSIYHSSKVEGLFYQGHLEESISASAKAEKWIEYSVYGGALYATIALILQLKLF